MGREAAMINRLRADGADLVQIRNPKTDRWLLVDRAQGVIVEQ
jgi:hypothetical protein